MDMNFVQDMLTQALASVDVLTLVILLAVGFCIKHFKFLEKIENDFIPPLLLVLAFVIEFVQKGFSMTAVAAAIITASLAIGLHTEGKNIFTVTILPKLIEMLKGMSSSGSTDPPSEDGGDSVDKE